MQVATIAEDTTAIRSLDWDRDRFDIEFGLQNGTTYNSFIIRGEKTALVDTSHAKFRELYMKTLKGEIDPATIDYIVVSHTEPDHSGLIRDVLALAPQCGGGRCEGGDRFPRRPDPHAPLSAGESKTVTR